MVEKLKNSVFSILNSKISFFLLMTFVALISFGLDLSSHQIYNFSQYSLIENNLTGESGFYAFDSSPLNPIYYYIKFVVPLLEYGAIFIVLSFLIRFLVFLLIYKILSNFLNFNTAVLLTVIFLMAYLRSSHGVIENGLWAELAFFPAVLSSLATLSGIYLFIRERFLLSGIVFAISILFHSLYGLTALAFLYLGFLIILLNKNDGRFLRNLALGILPILLAVLYLGYFRISNNIEIVFTHSIYEWFEYTSIPPSPNISLLWSIYSTGYCLIPIFITSFYFAYIEKERSTLSILTICSLIMLFVFILIEMIHNTGIFLDQLSELFISIQMRRGVWVAVLLSLTQIVKVMYENKRQIFESKLNILLLIFGISSYIFSSLTSIFIFYGFLFLTHRNRMSAILFSSVLLMSLVYYFNIESNLLPHLKTFSYSLIFSAAVIISMILFNYRLKKVYERFNLSIILIIILLFTSRGIYQKQMENDLSILIDGSIISKTNTNSLISFLKSDTKYDEKANLCMKSKTINAASTKIQLPITGIRNTHLSLFSFKQLFGFFNPMYSRNDFELSLRGLKTFFGSDVVDNFFKNNNYYNKQKLRDYFLDAYTKIPVKQLIKLKDTQNLRFYLLESERLDLRHSLTCEGDQYYVYDLSLL